MKNFFTLFLIPFNLIQSQICSCSKDNCCYKNQGYCSDFCKSNLALCLTFALVACARKFFFIAFDNLELIIYS